MVVQESLHGDKASWLVESTQAQRCQPSVGTYGVKNTSYISDILSALYENLMLYLHFLDARKRFRFYPAAVVKYGSGLGTRLRFQ